MCYLFFTFICIWHDFSGEVRAYRKSRIYKGRSVAVLLICIIRLLHPKAFFSCNFKNVCYIVVSRLEQMRCSFWLLQDQFFDYMVQQAIKMDTKILLDNRSKFLLVHSSSGFKHSLKGFFYIPAICTQSIPSALD